MRRWLALLLVVVGCAHRLPPTMTPAEVVPYTTGDGWSASVRHYPGTGEPVLLVHGMGVNHYNWDYREEVSLAAYLQARDYDVWVPDLRGDPGTVAPSRRARRGWTVQDHAEHDLPAVIDAVRAATGRDQLYWVGHSMGGILLYMQLARDPSPIAAGVAVCSPSDLVHVSGLARKLRHTGWAVGGRGLIPARALSRSTAWMGRANPLVHRVGNPDNLDIATIRGIARDGLIDLPKPMAKEVLHWLKAGELVKADGTPWLADHEAAATPLLVFGGAVDRIVPWYGAEKACARFGDCRFVFLGVADGFSVDYGHVDPVVGITAPTEVYPLIEAFLADQIAPPPGLASTAD